LVTGFVEVIKKGDKPGRCASCGKEMQITQTQSFEVLHSKPLVHGFVEVINKGDKPGRCASCGKEMQITQTQSVEVLHSKPLGVPVETR
jgi:predicted RNA-binding Zn-ribbon protein involved in translation (DUF1610 family)